MKLDGKTALITGGGSGIGAACAWHMAREGAAVAVTGVPAAGVSQVATELQSAGHQALARPTDVRHEEQIEAAVFDLLSHEKIVAEGAAGAGLAVVQKLAGELQGKKVGLVVCGGNIDSRILSTLILRGLVRDGRIARLTFEIDDTPGQLAVISRMIGEAGANVVEVIHQRMFQSVALKQAELEVVIEARDKLHVQEIVAGLHAEGFSLTTDLD